MDALDIRYGMKIATEHDNYNSRIHVKKIRYLPIIVFCLFAAMVSSGGDAAAEARLVMFEEDGCAWCEAWHDRIGPIYPKTGEGKAAPLRRVSTIEDRPADLKSIKGIFYTPTFVLVEDGREIGRIVGYPGEDFFWVQLSDLVAKLRTPVAAVR